MAQRLPIKFTELLQLQSAGVQVSLLSCCALPPVGLLPLTIPQQSSIGFNSCTLESDHFICVRQQSEASASPEVIIINLKNGNNVMRRPIKADSAIMHCENDPCH